MKTKRILFVVMIELTGLHLAAQQSHTLLFQSKKPLTAKLSFPMSEVKKNTVDSVYANGMLAYTSEQGEQDSLTVGVRARGNYRRQNCQLPPLRLKIKKSQAKKSLFAGNKNLKLVVPCHSGKNGDNLIMKEYLCYELYQVVTPYSFNARRTSMVLSNEGEKKTKLIPIEGFFIEDDDVMAERSGGKVIDSVNLRPYQMQDTGSVRQDFFQFMVANTDWSATFFHNVKIVQTSAGQYIPVPYDFDMAGLVNAPYATVNETLGIQSVRDRLYRGFCRSEGVMNFVRSEYLGLESAMTDVINGFEGVFEPKELSGIKKYAGEFFTVLKDDRKFKENIVQKCRKK